MSDRFQDEFESIELKFRVAFESLAAQGTICDATADKLSDILDAIDDMEDDEFEARVKELLGIAEHGGDVLCQQDTVTIGYRRASG